MVNTWRFVSANERAWNELIGGSSALDAIEQGCKQCEVDQCDGTVGYGGSPSGGSGGVVSLDAMIMDGETYDAGAVAALSDVRNAIGVARAVMEHTNHTLIAGTGAKEFAIQMGFPLESSETAQSEAMYTAWLANNCQPNYWINVRPDPKTSCGPYEPKQVGAARNTIHSRKTSEANKLRYDFSKIDSSRINSTSAIRGLEVGHDTIGMVAIDDQGRIASGTSTNGLKFKIPGRVGDSPIIGAGSYAAKDAGAAAATGDGDSMMRHLLSYAAIEKLRQGVSAEQAALDAVNQMTRRTGRPHPHAGVIVLAKNGQYGAACSGFDTFQYVVSDASRQQQVISIKCQT